MTQGYPRVKFSMDVENHFLWLMNAYHPYDMGNFPHQSVSLPQGHPNPPGFKALPQLYMVSFEAKMALLGSTVAGVLLNITQVPPAVVKEQ